MELLSPAGGLESLIAAVQAGADAVYLGGKFYSARAGAKNFDTDLLKYAINYTHLRGVKVFVTLNTLLKESEVESAANFAADIRNLGADALIVQDIGLSKILLKHVPDLDLHASTQMTVHNIDTAKRLEELGFKRVILARELSAEQIEQISKAVSIETEVFVHGALCYSYSGQCLFSSLIGGRSGNRGRCAQPCRLPYTLYTDNKKIKDGYLLSPKDLCLIDRIQELKNSGVKSLKIEGRLKPAGYVAAVTSVYRKYLDDSKIVEKGDLEVLLDAFNRSGFTHGHFEKKSGHELISYKTPTNIAKGERLKDYKYLYAENANYRKIGINAKITVKANDLPVLKLWDNDGNYISVLGDTLPQTAINISLTPDRIKAQIEKLGGTPFELINIETEIDSDLMLAASELNSLRRKACEQLEKKRIESNIPKEKAKISIIKKQDLKKDTEFGITIQVATLNQAKAALKYPIKRLYAPKAIILSLIGIKKAAELVTQLPDIINNKNLIENIKTSSVSTGILGNGHYLSDKFNVYGDFRLNIYNSFSADSYTEEGFKSVCLSPELNLHELSAVCKNTNAECEIIAYGHLPLMVTKACLQKGCAGKCNKGFKSVIRDRKKTTFPVICSPEACINIIYNSRPIYMADKIDDLKKTGAGLFRLVFTIENEKECDTIIQKYMDKSDTINADMVFGNNNFTRGHYYRGVE